MSSTDNLKYTEDVPRLWAHLKYTILYKGLESWILVSLRGAQGIHGYLGVTVGSGHLGSNLN
jgi:hypothetical protein